MFTNHRTRLVLEVLIPTLSPWMLGQEWTDVKGLFAPNQRYDTEAVVDSISRCELSTCPVERWPKGRRIDDVIHHRYLNCSEIPIPMVTPNPRFGGRGTPNDQIVRAMIVLSVPPSSRRASSIVDPDTRGCPKTSLGARHSLILDGIKRDLCRSIVQYTFNPAWQAILRARSMAWT